MVTNVILFQKHSFLMYKASKNPNFIPNSKLLLLALLLAIACFCFGPTVPVFDICFPLITYQSHIVRASSEDSIPNKNPDFPLIPDYIIGEDSTQFKHVIISIEVVWYRNLCYKFCKSTPFHCIYLQFGMWLLHKIYFINPTKNFAYMHYFCALFHFKL